MNAINLRGMTVEIGPNDVSEAMLPAEIIAANQDGLVAALKLQNPLGRAGQLFPYAVVSVRHEGQSLSEIAEGRSVVCAVTFVNSEKFSPEDPFDLSWWRGGNAAIAAVSLGPVVPAA